jgi:hypothetical protein
MLKKFTKFFNQFRLAFILMVNGQKPSLCGVTIAATATGSHVGQHLSDFRNKIPLVCHSLDLSSIPQQLVWVYPAQTPMRQLECTWKPPHEFGARI